MCGCAGGRAVQPTGVVPDSSDWMASPALLCGTCTNSTPARICNSSTVRCGVLPRPGLVMSSFRAVAFARAISVAMLSMPLSGRARITFGEAPSTVTGANSRIS